MRACPLLILALFVSSPVLAQEPVGCDKFKWPVERERAALSTRDLKTLPSGSEITALPATAILALRPKTDANLPTAPERSPQDGTFAGYVTIKTAAKPGLYTVSLPAPAWLDVVQDGRFLKPVDFSGVTGCDGIRKVVQFEISSAPLVVQLSGVATDSIAIALLPANDP